MNQSSKGCKLVVTTSLVALVSSRMAMIPRLSRIVARPLLLITLTLAAGPLAAQEGQAAGTFDPGSRLVTRAELERLLEDTRAIALSPAYSEEVRGQAEAYIRLLEQRLVRGDFRAGDRIILSIDAQTQAQGRIA